MNIDISKIRSSLLGFFSKLQRYSSFIFIMGILLLYSFLIFNISRMAQVEPAEANSDSQTTAIKRLKIDQSAIDKMQELQDQNIAVQSLFEEARDNPFQN